MVVTACGDRSQAVPLFFEVAARPRFLVSMLAMGRRAGRRGTRRPVRRRSPGDGHGHGCTRRRVGGARRCRPRRVRLDRRLSRFLLATAAPRHRRRTTTARNSRPLARCIVPTATLPVTPPACCVRSTAAYPAIPTAAVALSSSAFDRTNTPISCGVHLPARGLSATPRLLQSPRHATGGSESPARVR